MFHNDCYFVIEMYSAVENLGVLTLTQLPKVDGGADYFMEKISLGPVRTKREIPETVDTI